jgi:hypothetical protein
MGGRADWRAILLVPAPGIWNSIRSGPAFEFASVIAWRSEPEPESFVVMTVKVAAELTIGIQRRQSTNSRSPSQIETNEA